MCRDNTFYVWGCLGDERQAFKDLQEYLTEKPMIGYVYDNISDGLKAAPEPGTNRFMVKSAEVVDDELYVSLEFDEPFTIDVNYHGMAHLVYWQGGGIASGFTRPESNRHLRGICLGIYPNAEP